MKKHLTTIITATMLITVLLLPASALRGKWDNLTWTITNGTLTVSGSDIPNATASSAAPWQKFAGTVTEITVGNGVTAIGDRAFEDMTNVTSVNTGKAVTVGKMAFSGCTSLKTVTLPESVMSISDHAFAECTALTEVTLPNALLELGNNVFDGCTKLRTVNASGSRFTSVNGILTDSASGTLLRYPPAKTDPSFTTPKNITTVAPGAFRDAVNLTSADLTGVTAIGDGAFYGCTALTSATVTTAEQIGRAAFWGCSALTDITFGKNLHTVGDQAFASCSSLGIADFPGNAPAATPGIFDYCHSSFTVLIGETSTGFTEPNWLGYPILRHGDLSGELEGIKWSINTHTGTLSVSGKTIPNFNEAADSPWYSYRHVIRQLDLDGVTRIGKNSFRYTSIRSLTLPASVTSVGEWAFSGCQYLEDLTVTGKTAIDPCAFFACTGLTTAKLESVTAIGKQAFSGCTSLKYVRTGKSAPTLGEYAFDATNAAILYPIGGDGYTTGEWTSVYSEAYLPGDANGDGKTTISDVSQILKYIAAWEGITVQKISADTNADGKINITDCANILKHIAKWDIEIGIDF